jgi:hypothetical protein
MTCLTKKKKPFKGWLLDWEWGQMGNREFVLGLFSGHPDFHGMRGYTSYIVSKFLDEEAGIWHIETLNSMYNLNEEDERARSVAKTRSQLVDNPEDLFE